MRRTGVLDVVASAVIILSLLVLAGCGSPPPKPLSNEPLSAEDQAVVDYVTANYTRVDSFADDGHYAQLEPLRPLADASQVMIFGEFHGIADSYAIALKLMKYLQTLGYRYLAVERDFTDADRYNQYLASGDMSLIKEMELFDDPVVGNNGSEIEFWQDLYSWNKELPDDQRITVLAVDISHQQEQAAVYIGGLISSFPDSELAGRVSALYSRTAQTYVGMKTFASELDSVTAGLDTPPIRKLKMAVKSLKDSYAYYADMRGDKSIANDYPNIGNIRDLDMLAFFDYYWKEYQTAKPGKVFAYMGGYHATILDAGSAPGSETFGTLLEQQYPATTNHVGTVREIILDGKFRTAEGSLDTAVGSDDVLPPDVLAAIKKVGCPYMLVLKPADKKSSYDAYIFVESAVPAARRP